MNLSATCLGCLPPNTASDGGHPSSDTEVLDATREHGDTFAGVLEQTAVLPLRQGLAAAGSDLPSAFEEVATGYSDASTTLVEQREFEQLEAEEVAATQVVIDPIEVSELAVSAAASIAALSRERAAVSSSVSGESALHSVSAIVASSANGDRMAVTPVSPLELPVIAQSSELPPLDAGLEGTLDELPATEVARAPTSARSEETSGAELRSAGANERGLGANDAPATPGWSRSSAPAPAPSALTGGQASFAALALDTEGAADEMARQMSLLVQRGGTAARLLLRPDALGALDVRVEHRDGEVSVSVFAQNPVARELLEQHVPRLREALADEGLSLESFEGSLEGSETEEYVQDDRGERSGASSDDEQSEQWQKIDATEDLGGWSSGRFDAWA